MRRALPAVSIAAGLILTGCSDVATYQQRMDYLRKTTQRGVEAHLLLRSQGARIDAKRCEAVYRGLVSDIPADSSTGNRSVEWRTQVKQFFVDSCVTGLPKPLPTPATTPPSPGDSTTTSSPSKG